MKKSRYSEEQIVRILREADRDSVVDVAKRHGVSEASIYAWRKRFGEMVSSDVKRLKTLESENTPAEEAGGRAGSRNRGDEGDLPQKNGERTGSPGANPFCNETRG
jgi:putative transposase